MTRLDLYEEARLCCVDCGEVLAECLQRCAALRCHDCADDYATRGALVALEAHTRRAVRVEAPAVVLACRRAVA